MKKIILLILILLFFSLISFADFETGNSLISKLSFDINELDMNNLESVTRYLDYTEGFGYVIGVFDMGDGLYYEAPGGVTRGQILDIAKKYLADHPESRHEGASILLLKAFKEVFPIKKDEDKKGRLK